MEHSLSLTFTIDNGVAQSADGSLLWTLHPPSPSGQRHLQEQVEEEEEAEFLDDASDYDDDDLSIDMEITQTMMQHLRDLIARERQGAHYGGAGEEGAVFVPASGAAVAGLEKQAFDATAERCGAITGCAICLENFEDGEEVTVMPCSRGHEFHPDCITMWLGKSNTCPLCRHALPTDDVMDDDDL